MRTEIIIAPPLLPTPPPKCACHPELNPQLLLHGDQTFPSWGPFLESADNIPGPKTSYVCRVCIHDQSFNNFENDTIKVSVNEAKLTGLWARNCATIQQV